MDSGGGTGPAWEWAERGWAGLGWAGLGCSMRDATPDLPGGWHTDVTARQRRWGSAAGATGPLGLSTTEYTPDETAVLLARPPSLPALLHQLPYEPHEFGGFEGLGEERVDAGVETAVDLVLSAGTDDGEGKVSGPGVGTQLCGGPQPVQAGHDHIEGHDIGTHLMNDIQTLDTIGRGHDLETLQLEIDPDQLPDDLVVVHNKHPTRRAWHNSRVGADRPPRPGFPHFHPVRGTDTG